MSGLGSSPMNFQCHDSNTGGSNNSADGTEPSPEKPVTNPRTPTERKRKRKTNTNSNAATAVGQQPGTANMMPADIISEAHKTNKPINEYFPKRAPSSPVRHGGTKSPLSFGSVYPQSPKTPYVSSPSANANNGPPLAFGQGDYFQPQGTKALLDL